MMEEQYCKKCKNTKKRKDTYMKKMKNIEKRNWNKNTILIYKPLPVLFVIVQ